MKRVILMIDLKNYTYVKRRTVILACMLLFLIATAHCSSKARKIIRVRDGTSTSFQGMVEEISSARVVFVGEQHNVPAHHKTQLDVIKALHENGIDLAIGLEMFIKENQKSLDGWISGKIPERSFVPIFLENWGFGWKLYRDIFLYAREHTIPLVGLNVPQEITRKVGRTGFRSLTDEERKKLPPAVTCALDEDYMDHLVQIFQVKKSNDRSFVFFCEAQVLWDQAMAWYLADYMKNNPGKTVIVLAGAIHAWKYGIPKQKEQYFPVEQRVIVPDLPVEPEVISEDDTDYLVIHG